MSMLEKGHSQKLGAGMGTLVKMTKKAVKSGKKSGGSNRGRAGWY
jgi:hypothetical protein